MCEKLYDIWWRNMGYVGGEYEEIRKNRNENAKAEVSHQLARQARMHLALSVLEML